MSFEKRLMNALTGRVIVNTGRDLTLVAADTGYTVTGLVSGGLYAISAESCLIRFGIALCTSGEDESTRLGRVHAGDTVLFTMPDGYTTLHYCSDTEGAGGLVQVENG